MSNVRKLDFRKKKLKTIQKRQKKLKKQKYLKILNIAKELEKNFKCLHAINLYKPKYKNNIKSQSNKPKMTGNEQEVNRK